MSMMTSAALVQSISIEEGAATSKLVLFDIGLSAPPPVSVSWQQTVQSKAHAIEYNLAGPNLCPRDQFFIFKPMTWRRDLQVGGIEPSGVSSFGVQRSGCPASILLSPTTSEPRWALIFPDALAVWRNRVADLFSELLLRKRKSPPMAGLSD